MIRKWVGIILLIISLTSCEQEMNDNNLMFSLIPNESKIVIQINDLDYIKSFITNNELFSNTYFSRDSLNNLINRINIHESKNSGLLSFSTYGKNNVAITFISKKNFSDSLKMQNNDSYKYNKYEIFKQNSFYKTYLDQTVVSSSSDIIIENIIRNYNSNKRGINDPDFYDIILSANKTEPINIFIDSKLDGFSKEFFRSIEFYPLVKSSWKNFDLSRSNEDIRLTGITRINDSIKSKLSILKNLNPKSLETDKVIPNNFESFFSFTITDSNSFIKNYQNYLDANSLENPYIEDLKNINEITFLKDQEKSVILNLLDPELINALSFSDSINDSNKIFNLNIPTDLKDLLHLFDENINLKFGILIDNFIILSGSINQLKKILTSYDNRRTLINDINYQKNKESSLNKYSFLWMANTKRIKKDPLFNNSTYKNLDSNIYPFIKLEGLVDKKLTLINFYIEKTKRRESSGDIYNELIVSNNNKIITPPKWLKNHRNNEYDFAYQDSENFLYLYSNKGDLYWKKKLSSEIIGEIQQVDLYKNGRLQMAFRTFDKFYIIDRNGSIVKPFEISIDNSNNINALSIFDYEDDNNYRFLISQDNYMKMYDSKGNSVTGFNPENLNSNIINPPVHIRVEEKDYILVQLKNEQLKILNRRGKDRISVKQNINFSKNNFFQYMNLFTTTDINGNLIQIDMNGNVVKNNYSLEENNTIEIKMDNILFHSGNTISINGKTIRIPEGRYTKPKLFNYKDLLYITITDEKEGKVYLYNKEGNLVSGFPIKGINLVDIIDADNDGKIELITQLDERSVIAYEIN